MRAALIRSVGSAPEVGEAGAPEGADAVEVLAAPLNPIDLAVSRGILATGHPDLPYVPGCEGVGRTGDGRLVWLSAARSGGRRTARWPSVRRSATPSRSTSRTAPTRPSRRLSASRASPAGSRSPGGRHSTAARTSSCSARRARSGSSRCRRRSYSVPGVVAAGRSAAGLDRAISVGADATVRLDATDDLVAAFKDAFGGEGPSYASTRSGGPAAAAAQAAVPWARIVNLGQSAGATSELSSAAVRFKSLSILGHTNFAVPADELADHYRRLVGHVTSATSGSKSSASLDGVAEAWRRQAEAPAPSSSSCRSARWCCRALLGPQRAAGPIPNPHPPAGCPHYRRRCAVLITHSCRLCDDERRRHRHLGRDVTPTTTR